MPVRKPLLLFLAVVGLAGTGLGAIACGSGEASGAAPRDVTIAVFQFRPGRLEVAAGTVVRWQNQDDIGHTATSGEPGAKSGTFDLPLNGKGSAASFTFAEPGVYAYFCDVHQSMRGEVVVR